LLPCRLVEFESPEGWATGSIQAFADIESFLGVDELVRRFEELPDCGFMNFHLERADTQGTPGQELAPVRLFVLRLDAFDT